MKRRLAAVAGIVLAAAAMAAPPKSLRAQTLAAASGDDAVVQARDALRTRDRARLAALRMAVQGHELAQWVEYWELSNRLSEAQQSELDAFAERWRGSYVEDRLRNDWLLELGRRRDWANLRSEYARFRMNDDREVACYAILAQHLEGLDVRGVARAAWLSQRDAEEGCQLLGQALLDARLIGADDQWQLMRQAVENNRPRLARSVAAMSDHALAGAVDALFKDPLKSLKDRRAEPPSLPSDRLSVLALWRAAAADPDAAVAQLEGGFATRLAPVELAHAWAGVARQAALKQHPRAAEFARRAWAAWDRGAAAKTPPWSDDLLAWHARAALRAPASDRQRWALLQRSIDAMSGPDQRDPGWVYWRARAVQAQAGPGPEGEGARGLARLALESIASPLHFYGQLATEELGRRIALPAAPLALEGTEREALAAHPGLGRALKLISIGLRNEGVREWNYSLRGLTERELLVAAQIACDREVWDRCINTSDRTRAETDVAQRYPLPLREQVLAKARQVGVDPAYVYGLIRQESRFVMDARSSVGASGLMQLMPATARWTAKKVGLEWSPDLIVDRDVNLLLGTTYLKLVLDDFGGVQAMGAAAYNAGPGRPRRWREGVLLEPAAWIEGIPFNETRDYVKKVLANAVVYAARLGSALPSLKARLGGPIGPRDPATPGENRELP